MKIFNLIACIIWLIIAGICASINTDAGFIIMFCTFSILHLIFKVLEEIKNDKS